MSWIYYLNVTLHVFAAVFWLGGMFFIAVVGAPVLRGVEPPELRARLFQGLGRSFRTSGWIAVGVLLVTGVGNLYFKGWLSGAVLSARQFWMSPHGFALAWKLGAVAAMLLSGAVHDFWLGPRASRLGPGSPEGDLARRQASILGRLNAVLGIVVVLAAVRLSR